MYLYNLLNTLLLVSTLKGLNAALVRVSPTWRHAMHSGGNENQYQTAKIVQSVYGSFFEYSDSKQNQKKQLKEYFFVFFWFGFESEKEQKE